MTTTIASLAAEFDMQPYEVAAALDLRDGGYADTDAVDEAEAREVLQLMADQAEAGRA